MNHITPQSGIPTNLKRLPCLRDGLRFKFSGDWRKFSRIHA